MRVGVVNYGMGNLGSVVRALKACGGEPTIIDRPDALATVEAIVLPGVGAFDHAMHNLRTRGLVDALHAEVIGNRIPLLGICLGMQVFADRGFEGNARGEAGLGWVAGDVVRLGSGPRVPHIGWNEVHPEPTSVGDALFDNVEHGTDFYFVHSYRLSLADPTVRAATTPYGGDFCSAVMREHIWGVQFHPEKSQRSGFAVLRNFLRAAC